MATKQPTFLTSIDWIVLISIPSPPMFILIFIDFADNRQIGWEGSHYLKLTPNFGNKLFFNYHHSGLPWSKIMIVLWKINIFETSLSGPNPIVRMFASRLYILIYYFIGLSDCLAPHSPLPLSPTPPLSRQTFILSNVQTWSHKWSSISNCSQNILIVSIVCPYMFSMPFCLSC